MQPIETTLNTASARMSINAHEESFSGDARTTLLDFLRHTLGLTGTKKGCDHGQCGACTVIVNGRRINSCLSLAAMHDGDEIITVEGIGKPAALAPLQKALVSHDGYQCGYCTPGQICSATAMLEEIRAGWASDASDNLITPQIGREELSERMSGNICRCGAYPNILDALQEVMEAQQ